MGLSSEARRSSRLWHGSRSQPRGSGHYSSPSPSSGVSHSFTGRPIIYPAVPSLPCPSLFEGLLLSFLHQRTLCLPSIGLSYIFWLLPVFPILLFTLKFSHWYNLPQKPHKEIQHSAAVHRAKPNENVNRDQ